MVNFGLYVIFIVYHHFPETPPPRYTGNVCLVERNFEESVQNNSEIEVKYYRKNHEYDGRNGRTNPVLYVGQ